MKSGYNSKMKRMGGMIKEDHSAPSNLPMDYINSQYPMNEYINTPVSDDIYGIDEQINSAVSGIKKQLAKKKY